VVQTAFIDMYMKCGRLDLAMSIFENMAERSVVTWNVVIVELGTHGYGLQPSNCSIGWWLKELQWMI